MYKTGIQNPFHAAVNIVAESAHIKPLDIPHGLNKKDRRNISCCQNQHIRKHFVSADHIIQALSKLSFKPWPCNHARVIKDA